MIGTHRLAGRQGGYQYVRDKSTFAPRLPTAVSGAVSSWPRQEKLRNACLACPCREAHFFQRPYKTLHWSEVLLQGQIALVVVCLEETFALHKQFPCLPRHLRNVL